MPKLPIVESQATLSTQQPSYMAPESTEGKILEQVAKTAGDVQDTAYKWNVANASMQKTQTEVNLKTRLLDVHARAEVDPDYNSYQKYADEVSQIYKETNQGISDPKVAAEANLQLGYEAKAAQIQLQGVFKKKQIDNDRANVDTQIDMLVNNPTEGSFPAIKKILEDKTALGLYSKEDSFKMMHKAEEDIGVNRVNKDIYSAQTPEDVANVRNLLNSGYYEKGGVTIDPIKKEALLNMTYHAEKQAQVRDAAQQVQAVAQNRMETITGIASGDPKYQQLDMVGIAEKDPQLATALASAKQFMVNYNPKETTGLSAAGTTSSQYEKMKLYAKSIKDVFMHDNNQKLGDFVLQELGKTKDGLTPSVKIAAFANLAYMKAKANAPQSPEDLKAAERYTAIKNAVMFLGTANPYMSSRLVNDFMVKNHLSGAADPKLVMQEAKDVLRNKAIEKNAAVAKVPFVPNKVVDGDASVEDLHDGLNDLEGEAYSGNRTDQSQE